MEEKPIILIKYGGNAMLNEVLKKAIVRNIEKIYRKGYQVVVVHGGGPFIHRMLDQVNIESEFIEGHRKTSPEALRYIEMTLKGEVNGQLVNLLNRTGLKAVGLSGKDGRMVRVEKRFHEREENGRMVKYDLGRVGDVASIDTSLLQVLLKHEFIPVLTCLASDAKGQDYNINADMFAGYLAGALGAAHYLVLTDVDGLLRDVNDPDSIVRRISLAELPELFASVASGGMIPKLESCQVALEEGARSAHILNGTKPETMLEAVLSKKIIGTEICL